MNKKIWYSIIFVILVIALITIEFTRLPDFICIKHYTSVQVHKNVWNAVQSHKMHPVSRALMYFSDEIKLRMTIHERGVFKTFFAYYTERVKHAVAKNLTDSRLRNKLQAKGIHVITDVAALKDLLRANKHTLVKYDYYGLMYEPRRIEDVELNYYTRKDIAAVYFPYDKRTIAMELYDSLLVPTLSGVDGYYALYSGDTLIGFTTSCLQECGTSIDSLPSILNGKILERNFVPEHYRLPATFAQVHSL